MTAPARRRAWRWLRLLGGAVVVAVVVRQVGAGPFIDGIRAIDLRSIAAAAAITALTTLCCAWRWRLVAHALGVDLPARRAYAAYYRSQFLDATLPGGVLGDVHRGVVRGRAIGDVGHGLRAVLWERVAGQIVQVVLAWVLLGVLPSPVHRFMLIVALVAVTMVLGTLALGQLLARHGPVFLAHLVQTAVADLGAISASAWFGIVLTSCAAVAGYAAIFLLATHAMGATVSPMRLLPLVMLVLVAAAVPVNVAGFGPREGVAAWAFSAAGLDAGQGVAIAAAYGILVWVACLPGAVVLVLGWLRRDGHVPRR